MEHQPRKRYAWLRLGSRGLLGPGGVTRGVENTRPGRGRIGVLSGRRIGCASPLDQGSGRGMMVGGAGPIGEPGAIWRVGLELVNMKTRLVRGRGRERAERGERARPLKRPRRAEDTGARRPRGLQAGRRPAGGPRSSRSTAQVRTGMAPRRGRIWALAIVASSKLRQAWLYSRRPSGELIAWGRGITWGSPGGRSRGAADLVGAGLLHLGGTEERLLHCAKAGPIVATSASGLT